MERLMEKVKSLETNYKYSSRKYGYYNTMISVPSIMITSISGIFSFMSASEFVDPETKNYCTVTVAVLTTIASMLQTINASCEFNVRRLKFAEAAQQFNLLYDRVYFEIENPNEDNFIDTIETELEKIKNQCKFLPYEKPLNAKNNYIRI